MATPVLSGHTTATFNGSGATFVVNPSTNRVGSALAVGDWMILVIVAGTGSAYRIPTITSDWRTIHSMTQVGSGTMSIGVWAKICENPAANYTFSQSSNTNGTYSRLIWGSGSDIVDNWVLGNFDIRAFSGTTTTNVAPAITTTTPETLALMLSVERTIATETDAQLLVSNFTKQFSDIESIDVSLVAATKDMAVAGGTGSVTVTYPNPHTHNGIAGIIGITAEPPGPAGLPLKVSDGNSLVDAWFQVSDGGGGLIEPGDMKIVKPGYSSVAQMLNQDTFYIAHRGGSRDFPEMSLYAYGQSALYGYPALEFSVARTSDGVFFGLHDATLDRTSGVVGVDPGNLTWSQVQGYEILGSMAPNNPTQPNRPYMRWEELLEMYYGTHVIFLDPKVLTAGERAELLDLMDALPGSTSRFIGKSYGIAGNVGNTTGPAKDFSDRGYTTWGYFYQADAANFATYQGRWDLLGMDYNADQTTWNDIMSYGKPIIGHICPNPTAVTTALSKGADGIMVSGVRQITPPAITP